MRKKTNFATMGTEQCNITGYYLSPFTKLIPKMLRPSVTWVISFPAVKQICYKRNKVKLFNELTKPGENS